jgi:hypothetical protein
MIAYDIKNYYIDEYIFIGEDTSLKRVRLFAKVLIRGLGSQHLGDPNEEDKKKVDGTTRNSMDGHAWERAVRRLKNCPAAWHGQYTIVIQLLWLKLWPEITRVFGIVFLGRPNLS